LTTNHDNNTQVEVQSTAEAQYAIHSTSETDIINNTHSFDDAQDKEEGTLDSFDDMPLKIKLASIGSPGQKSNVKHANISSGGNVEDNGSVKSGESGMTSNTTLSTVVNSLRSNLIGQSTSARLGAMFARLHRLYAMTIVLVALLFLVTHVVQTTSLGGYPQIADRINKAGLRRFMFKETQYRTLQVSVYEASCMACV
jgi:hypothetical protein